MCFGQAIQPPTQKAVCYVRTLKIIAVFQLIISVLDIITIIFIREGILGFILLIMLINAFRKLSYQSLVSFTCLSIFFSITYLVYVMTQVQRGTDIQHDKRQNKYTFAIACISCAFYLFTSIFSFFPYRQFKAIQFSAIPGFQQYFNQGRVDQVGSSQQPSNPNQNMEYVLNYGKEQIQQDNNDKKNQQGTFQAFQGKGVRIG